MAEKRVVNTTINGEAVTFLCEPRQSLLACLRDDLGLTGTKIGCNDGNCGACAVLLDGELVNSCLVLAAEVEGREITTVEGLGRTEYRALQDAFVVEDGLQCGYCTPGFLIASTALLKRNPDPSEPEIRNWLAGNLCRCTGYDKIVRSVQRAAATLRGEAPATPADMTPAVGAAVGTRPSRVDARDKVTGQAVFGTDVQAQGLLHGRVLRSPHAHARILSIDTSRAESMAGVFAVVTAADLPSARDQEVRLGEGTANFRYLCDNVLASEKVLYHGHALAAVAAATPHIADQALALIDVQYEVLPAAIDVLEAMEPDAPLLHDDLKTSGIGEEDGRISNLANHFRMELGDPEAAFADAAVVVEREFRSTMIHQGYIEPAAATASWSSGGTLTVHSSTQGSFTMRSQIAELLGMPESRIRVIPTEVGGAFGGKINTYLEVPCALLSQKSGRPVKTIMERHEVFTSTGPTSGAVMRIKVGANAKGRLVAATAELFYEAGAFPGSPAESAASNIFAVYDIPSGRIDGYDVVVNKPRTTPYRAPGLTNAVWAAEQVVDEVAGKLNMDPAAFRLANCASEGTRTISGMTHKSIGCREVLEKLRATEHYNTPLEGPNRGRGIAVGHWGNWGAQSSATISVNFDGTVSMVSGSVDLTGTRTSLAMIVADVLCIPLDWVSPIVGDTASVGYTQVTAGSRTTTATSRAVTLAAEEVLARMKERVAAMWEVPADQVLYDAGAFTAGDHSLTFKELAGELESNGGPVAGVGTIDVTDWGGAIGAHIADVEVDPETGKVKVIRYSVVQDVGKAIHPGQIEGQIHGGVAQGIGWALYEGYQWDTEGHVLNANLLDYKLPTALDIPFIETHIVEVPYPAHPMGIRGVGEIPIVPPAAAVANAIHAATGARLTRLPMTPGRIREAGSSV